MSAIIGGRVRARRTRLRMTQAELAGRLGHQKEWIARIEAETRGTTTEQLVALCEELETHPSYLLGFRHKP